MKIQILYTSLTGCTRRVAQAICDQLSPTADVTLHDLKDGVPTLDGDILLVGYWGVSGGPCDEMREVLSTIRGKAVGIFCTLGYYADSAHAFDTVQAGVKLLQEHNEILGSYVCNGAISPELKGAPCAPSEQKHLRWEITDSHPTAAECALAAERFRERIHLYTRAKELGIPFQSIL